MGHTLSGLATEHVGPPKGRRTLLAGKRVDGRGTKFEVPGPETRLWTRQDGAVFDCS